MKALIVIFLLCGEPTFLVGSGVDKAVALPVDVITQSKEAIAVVRGIQAEDPQVAVVELEDITGVQCI